MHNPLKAPPAGGGQSHDNLQSTDSGPHKPLWSLITRGLCCPYITMYYNDY